MQEMAHSAPTQSSLASRLSDLPVVTQHLGNDPDTEVGDGNLNPVFTDPEFTQYGPTGFDIEMDADTITTPKALSILAQTCNQKDIL